MGQEATVEQGAPAVVRASVLNTSVKYEQLTASIGAQLLNVNLGDASRDPDLFAEIKALLLQYKVLFLRDQDFTRAEHVAFARRLGPLEDHPVAGSDPDHPRWLMVDVKFRRRTRRLISLEELKQHADRLEGFPLIRRGNRLSVMPVDKTHWDLILALE